MSPTLRRTLALAVLLGLGLAPALRPAPARAEVIERVVAVVNEDAIFVSELRRRAAPFLDRIMQAPSEMQRMAAIEQLYGELLERMVQEKLFTQAGDRMGVSVTRAEVDRAIGRVRQQSGLDEPQFWEAVRAQGFTEAQYRNDVRTQLLRLKVLNNRARGRVNITEQQVRERFDMQVARARRQSRFTVAQVFVEVPTGASATEVARLRERALDLRAGIRGADDFWAAGGMDLGTLEQGALPEALEDALMDMEIEQISAPVRGPAGFHIFLLQNREQAAANIPPYDEVRMEIYQGMMEEAMAEQEASFLEELRRQAVVDIRL